MKKSVIWTAGHMMALISRLGAQPKALMRSSEIIGSPSATFLM
jgi:hypothetical protein